MRWIYISPHLDDAILSAGGLIYDQVRAGMDVQIWTFMCGFPPDKTLSPFAQALHQRWGVGSAGAAAMIDTRRAEDLKAADMVGAKTVHFNFLDCIYRRGKNGDWLYTNVFVAPHEDDGGLPAQLAESMSASLQPADQLVCQLGLGSHLDHLLVRRAVELLRRPILYDADIPYLFNAPEELAPKTLGMKPKLYPITDLGLQAWQNAVAAYESQLGGLFKSPADMRAQIQQYGLAQGGIYLWSPA
jgi:LmbE family N-acetylglucosaminyl deacetylase